MLQATLIGTQEEVHEAHSKLQQMGMPPKDKPVMVYRAIRNVYFEWCPFCGLLIESHSPDSLINRIAEHRNTKDKVGDSECDRVKIISVLPGNSD